MTKPANLRIEDVAAVTARSDLNDILISLASLQTTDGSGTPYTGEPTSTYPNMLWYDKATSILKMRTTADDAWISVAYVDQSGNAYRILDDTQVVNTSGTQVGLIGDQSTATWETGVGTTESLVSPAKIKSAIDALAPTWDFESSGVSTGSIVTNVAHGLGARPRVVSLALRCVSATFGYSVGDEVYVQSAIFSAGSRPENFGITYSANATNVTIRRGDSGIRLVNTSGQVTGIGLSAFEWIVRASL
jgi:hypothetical protein